jgi:phosphonate transport system ATP-binding protein
VDEPIAALDPALARHTLATLRQEAGARGATLVCSLHQVELAREQFPRLVGLREGRIVFDLPAAQVSDAMIAELYANETVTPDNAPPHETPDRLAVGACY